MAVTVQSYNTAGWNNQSITITKPTGLAEGDLLMAVIAQHNENTGVVIDTPAGWTETLSIYKDVAGTTDGGLKIVSKIADSSDVAASDFTFTESGFAFITGTLFRITGAASISNVLDGYVQHSEAIDGSSTGWSGSFTPSQDGSVLLMPILGWNIDKPSPNIGIGSYSISGTNPSWTETQDNITDAGDDAVFALAYADLTTSREITTFDINKTGDDGARESLWLLIALAPEVSVTVSTDVQTITSSVLSATVSGDAAVSTGVLSASFSVFSPTVIAKEVIWNNESRPVASDWIIEDQI